jgi:flavin reductase (DIM6/NTAB) family NADH-FMN oxidoreductase RutF
MTAEKEERHIDKETNRALRLLGNGVFVVAAQHEGRLRGFTATWVMQASFCYPIVVVSVGRAHATHPLIAASGSFVVNVLGSSQADVARHFGRKTAAPGEEGDYFREEGGRQIPVLREALATLTCRVMSAHEVADQTLFVGEVTSTEVLTQECPLLFWPARGFVSVE